MVTITIQFAYAERLDFPVFHTESGSLATPDERGVMVYLDVSPIDQVRGIQLRDIVEDDNTVEPANKLAHDMWRTLAACGCVNHAKEGIACKHDITAGNNRRTGAIELFLASR